MPILIKTSIPTYVENQYLNIVLQDGEGHQVGLVQLTVGWQNRIWVDKCTDPTQLSTPLRENQV